MERRGDRSRSQHADPHAFSGRLGRQRLAQRHHVRLAGIVGRLIGAGRIAAQRGQVENSAAAPGTHAGEEMPRQGGERADIEIDQPVDLLRRLREERAGEADAGAVHQHVGVGAVLGQRGLDAGDCIGRRDVERQRDHLDLGVGPDGGGRLLQRLGVARDQQQIMPAARELTRQRQADAAGRAGDHRHRPQAGVGRQRRRVGTPPAPAPGGRKFLGQTGHGESRRPSRPQRASAGAVSSLRRARVADSWLS